MVFQYYGFGKSSISVIPSTLIIKFPISFRAKIVLHELLCYKMNIIIKNVHGLVLVTRIRSGLSL